FACVGLGVYYGANSGLFHIYENVSEFGWAYWTFSLLLIVVAHDAYFYWTHRLMHVRILFPWTHRVHHQSYVPTQWAAYSFSVAEALMQVVFLPIFLLAVPLHLSVIVVWMLHQVLRNAAGHCGVELMTSRWIAGWWS